MITQIKDHETNEHMNTQKLLLIKQERKAMKLQKFYICFSSQGNNYPEFILNSKSN